MTTDLPDVRQLILRCDCGVEDMRIDLWIKPDEVYDESFITFCSHWNERRDWRERIKAAWTILRGKAYYFDEVILSPGDVQQLVRFFNPPISGHTTFTVNA